MKKLNVILKQCTYCKEELPLSNFYKLKASSDGHTYGCKICIEEAKKKDGKYSTYDLNGKRISKNRANDYDLIYSLYLKYNNVTKVANELKCREQVVYRALKGKIDLGTGKEKKRIFYLDENFFDQIDTEKKAYWLGFLYADGYIGHNQGLLKVALKDYDENHLEKFLSDLNSNYEIKEYRKGYKEIRIWSRTLVNGLEKHGCFQNKSGSIKFPNFLDEHLIRHFIRGYFDGDGGVCISHNKLVLNFTGLNSFLNSISIKIKNDIDVDSSKFYIRREKSPLFGSIIYAGYRNNIKLIEYLYKSAKIFLDRKFKKIFDNLKYKYNTKNTFVKTKLLLYNLNKEFKFLEKSAIIYDVDSVLADFVSAILQRAKELGYEKEFPKCSEEVSCWNICDSFYKVFETTFEDKKFWLDLKLMPNVNKNIKVDYYLTARNIPTKWTEDWIKKVGLPIAKVITVKNPLDKIDVLKTINPKIFVDDHLWTVKKARDEGISAILLEQPYQKGHKEELDEYNLPIIKSLGELDKICQ